MDIFCKHCGHWRLVPRGRLCPLSKPRLRKKAFPPRVLDKTLAMWTAHIHSGFSLLSPVSTSPPRKEDQVNPKHSSQLEDADLSGCKGLCNLWRRQCIGSVACRQWEGLWLWGGHLRLGLALRFWGQQRKEPSAMFLDSGMFSRLFHCVDHGRLMEGGQT